MGHYIGGQPYGEMKGPSFAIVYMLPSEIAAALALLGATYRMNRACSFVER